MKTDYGAGLVKMRYSAALLFAFCFMMFLPALGAAQEDVPEVVLEAYSEGYYRPSISYEFHADSGLVALHRNWSDTFNKRLKFALAWSGYVNLFTKEDSTFIGPRETDRSEMPGVLLNVSAAPAGDKVRARATMRETIEESEPFYAGGIAFTDANVVGAAEAVAEEAIRQLTGKTPPFRSRIACVQKKAGNIKELVILSYDGSQSWALTRDRSIALSPSWSPDGQNIVFCSFRGGADAELYVADLGKRRIRKLLTRSGTDAAPAWSPKGDLIAFAASSGPRTKLYVVKPDGSSLRRLTSGWAIDTSPSWSPTGHELVFMSDRSGSPQIYRMNSDGTNLRRLTKEGRYNADPAWSPEGDRIIYLRRAAGGFQIRSMDTLGEVDVPLTDELGDHLDPAWSPDGMKITYSYRGKVWVMNADGTQRKPLLSDGLMPSWSVVPE